ncbi:MAG: DUF2533 family protein [Bacillaceae bacterium]|nr:DUF2533 family protein [Bacillaceae bacterium]
MSVHRFISQHLEKKQKAIQQFTELDQQREQYIEEAIERCKQGLSFSTEKINEVTGKMNELAANYQLPRRKYVTEDMVKEFVSKH